MLDGLGALTALTVTQRQGSDLQARYAARSDNQAAMERFRAAASKYTDVESLMKDRKTLQVVLEAFQLEGEIDKRGILNKVLTEDPTNAASLANRLTDRRWRDLANAFAQKETSGYSTSQVAALTTTQVQGLSLSKVAGLNIAQLRSLTGEQVQALSASQVHALDAEAIIGMDASDITAMSGEQIAALRPSQLAALSAEQVRSIDPAGFAGLGSAQIRGFGETQIAALTPAQLAGFNTSQTAAMTGSQIRALSTTQRAAFSPLQKATLGTASPAGAAEQAEVVRLESRGPLQDSVLVDRLVRDALTNRYEKAMGDSNAGLREALYFIRNAANATTINGLMTDKALTTVVRGSLGLPDSFAALDFDKQQQILTQRVNLADLQDPRTVLKMAQRYLALAAPALATTNPLLALFTTSSGSGASFTGISLTA